MFELYQSEKDGKFYFRLKAKNGQVILMSEGYESKISAQTGISSVKNSVAEQNQFEIRKAKNGKSYFVLKAKNGKIVGKSQFFWSESSLTPAITEVIEHAKAAAY